MGKQGGVGESVALCVCVDVCVCALTCEDLGGFGLEGDQTGWSVCQHMEVRGGRGAHGCGPALRVHLVVDQPPLLQEGVYSAAHTQAVIPQGLNYNGRDKLPVELTARCCSGSAFDKPHDCTNVSGQVPAAGCGRQVLLRVQAVRVYHKVPVRQVTGRKRDTSCLQRLRKRGCCVMYDSNTHISGVLDLFFPLKNSGRALRSMA